MGIYDGLLGLVQAASLLRGDARTAYLVNEMRNERKDNRIREQIYGAPETTERDGTKISWNGARALPSGVVSGMLEQQGPTRPGEGALPSIPASIFSPEMKAAGVADRKRQLMALPAYQKIMEQQMFAPPKPPKFMEAAGGIAKINEEDGTATWALEPKAKAPEMSALAKLQAELDAMAPGDPRRRSWEAAIKRESEGAPAQPKNVQTDTFDDGIFVINPDGTRGARLGNAPARERMPRVKTYYDEEGNPVTLDANDAEDQRKIKEMALVENAPTESERTSRGFLNRMVEAEKTISKLLEENQNFDPNNMTDKLADSVLPGSLMQSTPYQQFWQAAADWYRAKLRKESGAVIGDDEMKKEIQTYFPVFGDAEETTKQKKGSRSEATKQLAISSGILGRKYMRSLDQPVLVYDPVTGEFKK